MSSRATQQPPPIAYKFERNMIRRATAIKDILVVLVHEIRGSKGKKE